MPQPGHVMPNRAFVGHTGVGPPGVVGSATASAAHPHTAPAATRSGPAGDVANHVPVRSLTLTVPPGA